MKCSRISVWPLHGKHRDIDWRTGMKLMWFHLMPYTELPDDFREKTPSVWVDIHSSLFDPRRAHHMYNDFMDELEFAAECGFDAVCVNEHHSNGYGLMPSPNLIASALSRRTTDTAICVMGNSLALYNPPTRVAEEFAMIDVISGGRLIAGFPESRVKGMELYREPAEYFYGRCLRVDPRWAMPPGYVTEPTQRAGIQGQIGRAASLDARQKARATTQMEDIVDRGYVIIGSPDEVAEQLMTVATDLNVGHLMMLLQFGSMGKDLAKYNTKLFAERVMPQLTGRFSEWEDRWWPAPMSAAERAAPAPFQPGTLAAE